MDSSLRDTTINSIARWKRRLEGTSTPSELALIGREAEQLRGLALSRGESALADQLARLAALTGAPAAVVSDAVRGISELVGMSAPTPVQAPARPFAGTRLVGTPGEAAPAPIQKGSAAPPPAPEAARASPAPAAPALSMAAPPPLMMSRLGAPSMLQPSMILDPAQAPPPAPARSPSRPPDVVDVRAPVKQPSRPPVLAGTMLSGRLGGGNEEPRPVAPPPVAPSPVAAPRPAAGSPPPVQPPLQPPPPVAANPNALPPSVAAPVRPPNLLAGTFLGFRAFRGQAKAAGGVGGAPTGEDRRGLLGLQRLAPLQVDAPRMRAPSYPPVDRPRRRLSLRPSTPESRVDVPRWFYVVVAAIGALAAVVIGVIVVNATRGHVDKPVVPRVESSGSVSFVSKSSASVASGPAISDVPTPGPGPGLTTLGPETPQMRELLETQRRLTMTCQKDPTGCDRWTLRAIEVARNPIKDPPPLALPVHADEPLAAWLKPFKMPEQFPVRDEPALRTMFDYSAKNIAGHAATQSKIWTCHPYKDFFEATLTRYGAPHWLNAVAFQESGCDKLATSQVGARGLWQFMPESARAYGLRVEEGEIDERLSPMKSTDAAVHFLTDLQRELGAWDLALAAYNMGPYGVLSRITQYGHQPGFWDLANGGYLPDETAGYVPAIEAYAIVLQNMQKLHFVDDGPPVESAEEVIVKPGTRLSLIALAASTSTVKIHDLNPEFLRDVVPREETTARVPDNQAHHAQAVIDSWNPSDRRDTCVPGDFDWGKQQFETSRYAKTCAQTGNGP
jgi:hypothetical protein